MDLEEFVKKVLLDNALKYEGTCNPSAAMGAVMREFPEYRGKNAEISSIAQKLAKEINALSLGQQQELLDTLGGADAPEKEQRDQFALDYADAVLRFEPSPSGPLHIGHAYALGLNHLLQVHNDGKLILRIADTNPENIYPPAYDLIPDDASWFTHENMEGPYVQSERMELYYSYAEKMLANSWAYVCICESEAFKELINNKQGCPCRELPPAIHLERWELMLTEYEPGDAVVRIKTDVTHKNPAMRDWPMLRINTAAHPRQGTKYRVWPLMNFSVSIDDMEMGVTHTLRAKDHADNAKRQAQVYALFHYQEPVVFSVGRINFTNLRLSTTQTRKLIEEGEYSGWDDIRLPFLRSLRRRGFQPEALLRHAKEIGISPVDKKTTIEEYFAQIEAFNKDIIDAKTDRLFFVRNPVEIVIKGAPSITIEKDLHPIQRKGGRTFSVSQRVFVEQEDIQEPDGVLFRLMDAYNFRYENNTWVFVSTDLADFRSAKNKRIIHFLPVEENLLDMALHMPDGTWVKGKAEALLRTYEQGSIVQFERIGFARIDNTSPQECWFAHK